MSLENLCNGKRPLDNRDRLMAVDDPPFGHRPDRDTPEAAGLGEPGQESFIEASPTGMILLLSKMVEIFLSNARRVDPVEQPFQSGEHGVSRLVPAVVRIPAEEVVELGGALVEAVLPVQLRHGELVLIREEKPLREIASVRGH